MKPVFKLKEKIQTLIKRQSPMFIEIRGRETLLAEGYCRIEFYSETKITLSSKTQSFSVTGEGLDLRHLSSERLAIEGRIDSVEFI